jgi:hypothetical protein
MDERDNRKTQLHTQYHLAKDKQAIYLSSPLMRITKAAGTIASNLVMSLRNKGFIRNRNNPPLQFDLQAFP